MPVPVKIVVGVSMALVIVVVAAVTLAITYTVSIGAIHTAGENLAASMSSTIGALVSNYMNETETAMHNIMGMGAIAGYMLPSNDTQPMWWTKWVYPLRTHMENFDFEYSTIAVITDDGGLVTIGKWWVNSTWIYAYVLDPRSIPVTGKNTVVDISFRNRYNNRDFQVGVDGAASFYPFNVRDQRLPGYYSVLNLLSRKPQCMWVPPGVDTFSVASGDYVMYGSCAIFNQTKQLLGSVNIGLRLNGIAQFLDTVTTTPNTQVFIVDVQGLLVGSTYSAPYQTFHNPNETGIVAGKNGCVSSNDQSPGPPERIGCRAPATEYPYGPLRSIANSDSTFLSTPTRDQRYGSLDGDKYFYVSYRIPTRNIIYNMNLLLFLPEADVLGDIMSGLNLAIGVTVAVLVVAIIMSNILLQVLLAPLDDVAARMYRVANLQKSDREAIYAIDEDDPELDDLNPIEPEAPLRPSSMTEIRALQVAYETMDTAIQSFTRYVPKDVVRELVLTSQICEIAMHPMTCSMLFTDIAGFTSICERVPPPVLSGLVKLYFERTSRIVMGHGGIIDKFIGDCIMAVWGAPLPIEKHDLRAAICGYMLVHETRKAPLKDAFEASRETLDIRVGVATGEVLAGNMGSDVRMSYTVIGDDVNLASRLESLNKQWGTNVMISEVTALECEEWLVMRHVVTMAVVGKDQSVGVHEVLGVRPEAQTEVLGAATGSASSETRTMTDVKRDREKEALGQVYLTNEITGERRLTVGQLLRRAMRKAPVAPELILWATEYSKALAKFEKGDFAGCISALRDVFANPAIPQSVSRCKSSDRLIHACEEYIRTPPPAPFTGVWKAEEK